MPSYIKNKRRFLLKKIAEIDFGQTISAIISVRENWIIYFRTVPFVYYLDAELKVIWKRDYQTQDKNYHSCGIAINPLNLNMSIARENKISINNQKGKPIYEIKHKDWDNFTGASNIFTEDGKYFINVIHVKDTEDHIQLRDAKTFKLLDFVISPTYYCYYNFHFTAALNQIIIETAHGQDESLTYLFEIIDNKLSFQEILYLSDEIIGNLSSDKTQVITAPHYGDEIMIHDYIKDETILKINASELFEEDTDEGFSYQVKFTLSDYYAIVKTQFGRLVVIDLKQKIGLGEIIPEGNFEGYDIEGRITVDVNKIQHYGDTFMDFYFLGDTKILIQHYKKIGIYELPIEIFN